MRSARVGELVADTLRNRILSGTVASGERLPPAEEILKEFRVGLPSVREAMRILEVEGLVTVHRGNVGGATVHLPNEGRVAYMMAMVLESQRIQQSEVATALLCLEPICAEMCAGGGQTGLRPRCRAWSNRSRISAAPSVTPCASTKPPASSTW